MRYGLILLLGVLATRSAYAEPPSEPSADHWKKVLQTEKQARRRPAYTLTFSHDGKLLAGCLSGDPYNAFGGQIRIWDATTGKEQSVTAAERPRSPKFTEIHSLVYSPAGNLFAVGKQLGMDWPRILWEIASGKELPSLDKSDFSITEVAFSHDGTFIAVYGQGGNPPVRRVRVFDAVAKKEVFEVPCDLYAAPFVRFLPDGKTLIVAGPNRVLRFWDLSTGRERGRSPAIDGYIFALALRGKAVLADGISGKTIQSEGGTDKINLYDLETGKLRTTFNVGRISRLPLLSADGTIMLLAEAEQDGQFKALVLRRWDLSTGKEVGQFRGRLADGWDMIHSLALSADGQKLAVGCGEHLSLWVREKATAEK